MKAIKVMCVALVCGTLLLGETSCSFMQSNTGKGTAIGGGGGAAAGAGIGALIGGGKGAAIGAGIGAVVGAGAGALIGHRMDKQKKELEQQLADQATIEQTTDANGLQAIKVTFSGGILFATGKSTLSSQAQADLSRFAKSLIDNPDTDVSIYGYTDNTGSYSANQKVSTERANAVKQYLMNCGVPSSRLSAEGVPMADYVASNETEAGRAANRRVEIYITADKNMIEKANAGTLN